MSLQWVGQEDFAVGTLLGVGQDQQPGVGVEHAINGLFDDDGDVYRRGPVARLGVAPAPAPLTYKWSGFLGAKYVELAATAGNLYSVEGNVLVALGAAGLPEPVLQAVIGDLIFLPNGAVWGGSTKAAYNAGTVTVAQGNPVVTGAGTLWVANAEAGMLFKTAGRYYRVKSVDSNTQITLDEPVVTANAAGAAYTLSSLVTDGLPAVTGVRHLGTIANRLVIAVGNKVSFSEPDKPFSFVATDYHELPDGVVVKGIMGIRELLLLFTNFGLWSISGMAFNLTDSLGNIQHQLSRLTPELSLTHESGLAEWAGAIVTPCVDRVFLVDGLSPPVPISDSIAPMYMAHVRAGNHPGGAKAFRNHYFLPLLTGAGVPVALLVCRLNRPIKARQLYYPWSQWDGYPEQLVALDVDLRTTPQLRAVHRDGWLVDATASFPPFADEGEIRDPLDQPIVFDVQTRDFPTGGNGQPNHFRRMRLLYASVGEGQIEIGYSYGNITQSYQDVIDSGRTYAEVNADFDNYDSLLRGFATDPDSLDWAEPDRLWNVLDTQAIVSPGVDPLLWNLPVAERQRYVRARVRLTDPIPQFKIRRIQFAVRPTTHMR